MNIFAYTDYNEYLRAWLLAHPKGGRGISLKLAVELGVSSVLVSQIFSGTRILQTDYAYGIARFIGLGAAETDYFMTLVHFRNAGTPAYRAHLKKKIESLRLATKEVKNRVSKDIKLSEEAKSKFYSHWHYSAIRLSTDIPERNTPREISDALNIDITRVNQILDFLVENKLCSYDSGKYKMAVQSTHLESDSPWIYSRQLQWRQKAQQSMDRPSKDAIFYTGPMVISKKDKEILHDKIVTAIQEITEQARNSQSETLMCLNIDWFGIDEQDI